jgi:hypothetical protein
MEAKTLPAAGMALDAMVKTCFDAPSSSAAHVALKQMHQQCRASKETAAAVCSYGGVAAAHKMLMVTDSQEALGLLWSLSAIAGTLKQFTPGILGDIVRIGRATMLPPPPSSPSSLSKRGWRQTAVLSTLHNLLCYSGYVQVLNADALDLAVEVLGDDKPCSSTRSGARAAAALFLDQCCFDASSKGLAVQGLRLPVLFAIVAGKTSSRPEAPAHKPGGASESKQRDELGGAGRDTSGEDDVLLGHVLSLLWNASDDVFFAQPKAWEKFTRRLCQKPFIASLLAILAHGTPMQQQVWG